MEFDEEKEELLFEKAALQLTSAPKSGGKKGEAAPEKTLAHPILVTTLDLDGDEEMQPVAELKEVIDRLEKSPLEVNQSVFRSRLSVQAILPDADSWINNASSDNVPTTFFKFQN